MVREEKVYDVWFSCNLSIPMTAWGNDRETLIEEAEKKIKKELQHTNILIADLSFEDTEEW